MDSDLLKSFLSGAARQGIAMLGGYMGFTGSTQTQFVGAGMVIVSLTWEWWQSRGKEQFIAILAKMHPVAPQSATTGEAVKAAKIAVAQEQAK